jgi:Bifunctional DNA primase/polymerase, N-terminal/Family of unknown function (DUF5906)
MVTVLDWALAYSKKGFKVFPVHSIKDGECTCGKPSCGDAGKHPKITRWQHDATDDEAKIREWFKEEPTNIGIATGQKSGITIIDVDIGPGKKGAETWADLIKESGEPKTLTAITGSGGFHFVFKYNSVLKTSSNTLGEGVDCRNDGGYVVAAPSNHRSGGAYSWVDFNEVIADLPDYLTKEKERRGRPRKNDSNRKKYSIEEVKSMLIKIPADDRDLWRNIGVILGREFKTSDAAWEVYVQWADSWGGQKGRNHEQIMREAFYEISQKTTDKELSLGTIVKIAIENGWEPESGNLPIKAFVYFAPANQYIYRPTSTQWIAAAVDATCAPVNDNGKLIQASEWLKKYAMTTSMTNDPIIEGDVLPGFDCREGMLILSEGAAVYNGYRPPSIQKGDSSLAQPWVDHCRKVFNKNGDAEQFFNYMAHRVQKPWEKPRFALLIAGDQGVGKDTAIEMCIPAIGHWNVANIDPSAVDAAFNEFCSAVLIRVSETANLHDMNKWAFNERMKVLIAGTPDYSIVNPKYGHKYSVRLHCGIILTTNHMSTGIFIPQGDRRYDVIDSSPKIEMGFKTDSDRQKYFDQLWGWYEKNNGAEHIYAWLDAYDISKFSASNGQRKTEAHQSIVLAGMTSDHWALDALDLIGEPRAFRSDTFIQACLTNDPEIKEAAVRKSMNAVLGRYGYSSVKNPAVGDGRWKFNGKRMSIYKKDDVTPEEFDILFKTLKDAESF